VQQIEPMNVEAAETTGEDDRVLDEDEGLESDVRVQLRRELQEKRPSVRKVRQQCKEGLCGKIPDRFRADVWQLLLGTENKDRFLLDDSIRDTKQDLENQRVIKVDAQRTRADVKLFKTDDVQDLVARLLTFYCKRKGIKYKQGLNEVLAPFILLRQDPPLPEGTIFNMFYAFVEKFLPHAYVHEDFHALQCTFKLFRMLLLYHDPELCSRLDTHNLRPELYATPWFLTMFARNMPIEIVYRLWDAYLLEEECDGAVLHMFVALALTLENREGILQTHSSDLPIYLTSVLGPSHPGSPNRSADAVAGKVPFSFLAEKIDEILNKAKVYQAMTPRHFQVIMTKALLSSILPSEEFLEKLETQPCMYMQPSQVLHLLTNQNRVCTEQEAFVLRILDCRSREEFEQGHLIGSLHLDPALLNLPELLEEALESISRRIVSDVIRIHLVVVGSTATNLLLDSEDSLTEDNTSETRTLEEADAIPIMFVLHLIQRGLPRVSQLEGGWTAICAHETALNVMESGPSIDELVDLDCLQSGKLESQREQSENSGGGVNLFQRISKTLEDSNHLKAAFVNFKESKMKWKDSATVPVVDTSAISQPAPVTSGVVDSEEVSNTPMVSSFIGRVANRYFAKSPSPPSAHNQMTPFAIMNRAEGSSDDEGKWIDLSEWIESSSNPKERVTTYPAKWISRNKDINGKREIRRCALAIADSFLVELELHPDNHNFGSVREKHSFFNLSKITSKKSRNDLVIFHFGDSQLCYLIDKPRGCIDDVKARFNAISSR